MSFTPADKRRVFLACRPIFTGVDAQVRKEKAVRKIVTKRRQALEQLLADLGEGKVVDILRLLLEKRIFESDVQAQAQFPELFHSSPAQNTLRAESESDAARSAAELLNEIETAEGQVEDIGIEEDQYVCPEDSVPIEQEEEAHDAPIQPMPKVPTLYPLCFPFSAQHKILNTTQRVLEESCFEFAQKWLPQVLDSRGWDCAAAVELTKWSQILKQYSSKIPSHATSPVGELTLGQLLAATHRLRHAAVHRLPTTARETNKFILSALQLTQSLQDTKRASQFDELHHEAESKIKAMELHKNALEDTLRLELESIATKRKELDQQEASCIEKMITEDRENKTLVANLLIEFVERLFEASGLEEEYSESLSDEGTQVPEISDASAETKRWR